MRRPSFVNLFYIPFFAGHVPLQPIKIRNVQRIIQTRKTISQRGLTMYSMPTLSMCSKHARGLAEYYQYATDRCHLGTLKNTMQQSLVKTLAHKFKVKVSQIYRRYLSSPIAA